VTGKPVAKIESPNPSACPAGVSIRPAYTCPPPTANRSNAAKYTVEVFKEVTLLPEGSVVFSAPHCALLS
jgi:hypothetical protein